MAELHPGKVSPHKHNIAVTDARCEIVYREVNYVAYYEVYANGDKIYRYSDITMLYPNDQERLLDLQQYQVLMHRLQETDPRYDAQNLPD